mmetsp:Transcript_85732/g.149680  ORF Transcript_85732/g.149680 Transcript_85732/m.149680 type:complete len:142 (-) Transcript_85732:268-693(-)
MGQSDLSDLQETGLSEDRDISWQTKCMGANHLARSLSNTNPTDHGGSTATVDIAKNDMERFIGRYGPHQAICTGLQPLCALALSIPKLSGWGGWVVRLCATASILWPLSATVLRPTFWSVYRQKGIPFLENSIVKIKLGSF